MTTGERIKVARKAVGMTQAELAKKLGISYVGVSQWENNLRNPKLETIQKIANALNVPFTSLLDEDSDIGDSLLDRIEQRANELRQQHSGKGRAILSQEELDKQISAAEDDHKAFLEALCLDPRILAEDYPDRIRYVTSFIKQNADMLKLAMPGTDMDPDDIEEAKKIRAAGGTKAFQNSNVEELTEIPKYQKTDAPEEE